MLPESVLPFPCSILCKHACRDEYVFMCVSQLYHAIHQYLLSYSYICSIAYFVFPGVTHFFSFSICLVSIYLPLVLSKLNKKQNKTKQNHTIRQKTKLRKTPSSHNCFSTWSKATSALSIPRLFLETLLELELSVSSI